MIKPSWRPIPHYEGLYWVNSEGDVKNSKNIIISTRMQGGVKVVELHGNGQRDVVPVSTLILDVFPEIYKEDSNEK